MAASSGFVIVLFILLTTFLAIGYGFGVKTQQFPFTAELEFSESQWSFLKWWIQVSIIVGILLPVILWVQMRQQSPSLMYWGSYLFVVVVQLISERIFSRLLVRSVVVPIGFGYTAFRLWQLFEGLNQLSFSSITGVEFTCIVLFWIANLIMLITLAIPVIYKKEATV